MKLKSILIFIIIFLFPYLTLHFFDFEHAKSLSLLISIITLWFTEYIPLPVTALLVPVTAILYGLVTTKEAFLPFGNQILFLFIGSFLLATAMHKHGWDKRMSYYILSIKIFQSSLAHIIFIISVICWLLSMWISNTAACAIVTPIALALITTLKSQFSNTHQYKNFQRRILFSCAFGSSIGGMATPIGSPPNLLALEFLSKNGIDLTFFDWFLVGIPISLTMLIGLNLLLGLIYPLKDIKLVDIDTFFKSELTKLGKIKIAEYQVVFSFLLAVTLWMLPGLVKAFEIQNEFMLTFASRLPMGVVALIVSVLLFVVPTNQEKDRNLTWDDAKNIDWGTVILFGGGLCLGHIISISGLASYLGQIIFAGDAINSLALATAIAIALGIIMSEVGSNTASTTILLPIILGTFSHLASGDLVNLVMATTFGASFGFMLPVSTPPNAIIFGTGKVPIKQMIKTGVYFDLLGFLIIYGFIILRS